MAITNTEAIKNILKVFYRDGVENLLIRNSSALKQIPMTKVEGKSVNFAALYSRGGSVAADYRVARQNAAENVKNAEFSVEPGQLFSVYSYNAKEVQASLSKKGAYMKVAGNKMFAATTALRQTLAGALYGRGFGEVAIAADSVALTSGAEADIPMSEDAVAKIDIGSKLVVKTSVSDPTEQAKIEVIAINGPVVTVKASDTYTVNAGDVYCLAGSMDNSGNPILPMGLDGWLPIVNGRTGSAWTNHLAPAFQGVNRKAAPDRLAGQFYMPTAQESKSATMQKLLRKVRRAGSNADLVIMNDEDFLDLAAELEAQNRIVAQSTSKAAKQANIGLSAASLSFSTNFIENIIDDPFCPKGKFYILDKNTVEYFVYTNADKVVADGIADNNPGKQDAEVLENAGQENTNYNILIDDLLTVRDGGETSDGPAVEVALNFFGSLAVTNPSVNGVGLFYNAGGYTTVLGYTA